MIKTTDLRQLSVPDLNKKLVEVEKELVQARIAQRAGKTTKGNTKMMADDIARIKTIITEKELAV